MGKRKSTRNGRARGRRGASGGSGGSIETTLLTSVSSAGAGVVGVRDLTVLQLVGGDVVSRQLVVNSVVVEFVPRPGGEAGAIAQVMLANFTTAVQETPSAPWKALSTVSPTRHTVVPVSAAQRVPVVANSSEVAVSIRLQSVPTAGITYDLLVRSRWTLQADPAATFLA